MQALWQKIQPQTVMLFKTPLKYQKDDYTNQIFALVEFLLIESFYTYGGIGFNQEPGGQFCSGRKEFVTDGTCKALVQEFGISTTNRFHQWCKNNSEWRIELGIPTNPNEVFKNIGWVDWYEFLGTQSPVTTDTKLTYIECVKAVRLLGISTQQEFQKWRKNNSKKRIELGISSNPDLVYKYSAWIDWSTFLGTNWLTYDDCVKAVGSLCISTQKEFRKWCKDNPKQRIKLGIPSNPDKSYKNSGWKNWYVFLGKEHIPKQGVKLSHEI